MKHLDKKTIETRIKESLNQIEPKNLDSYLWNNGFQSEMGSLSTNYLIERGYFTNEVVEYCNENYFHDTFLDFYLEWYSFESYRLMEDNEEIKSIEDEEERLEVSHEWTDFDGFVYNGFLNLIYYLTGEVITDINYERTDSFEKKLKQSGFYTSFNEYDYDDYLESYTPSTLTISGYIDCHPVVEFDCEIKMLDSTFTIYTYEENSVDEYSENIIEFESFDDFHSQLLKLKFKSEELSQSS